MKLEAIHRLCHWAATEAGAISEFDTAVFPMAPSVETHPYAVSRFPLRVTTEHYRRRPDGGYGTTDRIAVGSSSVNAELVLALATGRNAKPTLPLADAMIVASEACERCMNALAFEYGLLWGYPEGGEEWRGTRTSCPMCAEGATTCFD